MLPSGVVAAGRVCLPTCNPYITESTYSSLFQVYKSTSEEEDLVVPVTYGPGYRRVTNFR